MNHRTELRTEVSKFGPWAVVTGASSGIGKEFARQLAARGLDLVLVARRTDRLADLATELSEAHGTKTRLVVADLADPRGVEAVFDATARLDVGLVVSNAGAVTLGPVLEQSIETLRRDLQLNLHAHLELGYYFGRRMKDAGRPGGLLLVSSVGALQGIPYAANYAASKAYVHNFAEALHHELAPSGIRVTVLAPGFTDTEMTAELAETISLPVPTMTAEATAREGIQALLDDRATRIAGLSNRMMSAVVPRRTAVRMFGEVMRSGHESETKIRASKQDSERASDPDIAATQTHNKIPAATTTQNDAAAQSA